MKKEIVYIKTHRLKHEITCPACGVVQDAATGVNDNLQRPQPGSLGICYDCGALVRYEAAPGGLKLRELEGGEFFDLPLSIQKKMAALSKHVKEGKKNPKPPNQ